MNTKLQREITEKASEFWTFINDIAIDISELIASEETLYKDRLRSALLHLKEAQRDIVDFGAAIGSLNEDKKE